MPSDPAQLTAAWFDGWKTKDADAIDRMMADEWQVRFEQVSPIIA